MKKDWAKVFTLRDALSLQLTTYIFCHKDGDFLYNITFQFRTNIIVNMTYNDDIYETNKRVILLSKYDDRR